MKLFHKSLVAGAAGALLLSASSCTDEFKFGNSFLEKSPGGDVTIDTVFSKAEYTKQYLAGIYSLQYYGLPYRRVNSFP